MILGKQVSGLAGGQMKSFLDSTNHTYYISISYGSMPNWQRVCH